MSISPFTSVCLLFFETRFYISFAYQSDLLVIFIPLKENRTIHPGQVNTGIHCLRKQVLMIHDYARLYQKGDSYRGYF